MRLALAAARTDATGRESLSFYAAAPLPTRALTATESQSFVGTYRNPRRFTVEVARQGDALVLKRFGRVFQMRALERDGEFVVDVPRGGSEVITFGAAPADAPTTCREPVAAGPRPGREVAVTAAGRAARPRGTRGRLRPAAGTCSSS